MRILYTTTIGLTTIFFKSIITELIKRGDTVDIACDESEYKVDDYYRELGCRVFQIDWKRTPLSMKNLKACSQLKKVISENGYDLVHCHTPIAGVFTRLACKSFRKSGLKVFYTAHGFHFYKGAPVINWLLYYPMEKYCSRFTDTLITINREDFELAGRKFSSARIEYVPGVGIDVEKFRNTVVDKAEKRMEIGIPENAILLLSVGELNKNKNHAVVVRSLKLLDNNNIHYVIVGEGALKDQLEQLKCSLDISENVHLIGYRNDVNEIMKCADLFVHPSFREGLPVSVMEALASGLAVIGADIRGLNDLIPHSCTVADNSASGYAIKIKEMLSNQEMNKSLIADPDSFSFENINKKMLGIYKS